MSWHQLKRSQFFCSTWDGFRKELPKLASFAEEADDSFDNSYNDNDDGDIDNDNDDDDNDDNDNDDDDGNNNDDSSTDNGNDVNNDSNNDNDDSFDNISFDYDDNYYDSNGPTFTSKIFDNYFAICNTASFLTSMTTTITVKWQPP